MATEAQQKTPEAQEPEEDLAQLGLSGLTEIHDEPEPEAASEQETAEYKAVKPEDVAAAEAEAGSDEEAQAPEQSPLQQFYEKASKQLAPDGGDVSAPDPKDLALQQARERERQALLDRIEDLKTQRGQPSQTETEPQADPKSEEYEAAIEVFADRHNMDKDAVRDLFALSRQLTDWEVERTVEQKVKPIEEWREQLQQQQQQQQTQAYLVSSIKTGLENLAKRGGMAADLALDFARNVQARGLEGALSNTLLGGAIVGQWTPQRGGVPPALMDSGLMEGQGIALAAAMEQYMAAGNGDAPQAEAAPQSQQPSGLVPSRRPTPTTNSTTPDADAASEELFEQTAAHMTDAFQVLCGDESD